MFEKNELNETRKIKTNFSEQLKRKAQQEAYLTKKTNLEIEKLVRERELELQRIKNEKEKAVKKLENEQAIKTSEENFMI